MAWASPDCEAGEAADCAGLKEGTADGRADPTESDQIKPFSGRLMAWMAGWTGDAGGRGAALKLSHTLDWAGQIQPNPTKSK